MVHDCISHALVVLLLICLTGSQIDSLHTLDTRTNQYRRIVHLYPGDVVAVVDPALSTSRGVSSNPTPLVQRSWGSRRRSQASNPRQPSHVSSYDLGHRDDPHNGYYNSQPGPSLRDDSYRDGDRYNSRRPHTYKARMPTSFHMRPPSDTWGYDDSDNEGLGPRSWHTAFPACGSSYQSPIDIAGESIRYVPLPPINIYSTDGRGFTDIAIRNSGSTIVIKPKIHNIIIDGGDLPGTFYFYGIHFHWSRSDRAGSEHRLDHRTYPLEMHIVSYNSKYPSMKQAMGRRDGIHVAGIFFRLTRERNHGLDMCISKLSKVRNPGLEIPGGRFNISAILPPYHDSYYRYTGSLTTPPCTDNVIWSVYSTPQMISHQQLLQFRQIAMSRGANTYYGGNVRPLQPIGDRIVLTNSRYYYKK